MKQAVYMSLILGLVPFQVTALNYAAILGIRPDLPLVAAFLIGFLNGELEGLLIGILLGSMQDLFSAGSVWINLITKGAVGVCAALLGRHLVSAGPVTVGALLFVLAVLAGSTAVAWMRVEDGFAGVFEVIQAVVIPEALFDAMLGAAIYWVLPGRRRRAAEFGDEMVLFGR